MRKYGFLIVFIIGILFVISGLVFDGQNQVQQIIPINKIQEISLDSHYIYDENYSVDSVKKINVNVAAGDIEIVKAVRENIAIKVSDDAKCKITHSNNCLKIEQESSWNLKNNAVSIVIEIPEYFVFDSADLDVGIGHLNIKSLNTVNLTAEVGVGELQVSKLYVKDDINIECGIGNVILELHDSLDNFDYEVNCGVGDIVLDSHVYKGVAQSQSVDHDKERFININCGIGNIEIKED